MSNLNQSSTVNKDGLLSNLIGTLGKKKKMKEVEELEIEGKSAIDNGAENSAQDYSPEDFILNELEERRMIDPSTQRDPEFQKLKRCLVNWINDELSEQRMIVHNLEELYDGSVLGKLVEKLSNKKLNLVEVTLNQELQKSNLREVLRTVRSLLDHSIRQAWTIEGIHSKDLVEIIQLLIALIRQFHVPIKLPEDVTVKIVVIQKSNGILVPRLEKIHLTGLYSDIGVLGLAKDEFDLIYNEPEMLEELNYNLILFLNEQFTKLNIECQIRDGLEIDPTQFSDGLLLIFLLGLCEDFFVPLGNIYMTPNNASLSLDENDSKDKLINSDNYVNSSSYHKLHNMNVAFQLMEDADIQIRKRMRPEEIINCDQKSLLRVLYMIFKKYSSHH